MQSLKIDDNFDISLDGSGNLSISENVDSLKERCKFDLESNAEWKLKRTLGLDWLNEFGTGFLQDKNSNFLLEDEITDKLNAYLDIDNVESVLSFFDKETNKLNLQITIKTKYGNVEVIV